MIIHFGYDAFARRTWQRAIDAQSQVTETFYLWAGEQLIAELRRGPDGTSRREYLWYPGGTALFALRIDGTLYYCHNDQRGAVQRVTDADDRAVWIAGEETLSAPWGGAAPLLALIEQPWRLPGQYHDAVTGLCYNRFRYFDARLRRYISPDPIGVLGGLDLYAYADNNPVNGSDPLGLWTWAGVAKVAVSVAARVAVRAQTLALAPAVSPLGMALAGAAAATVGLGLNAALNQRTSCFSCIAGRAKSILHDAIDKLVPLAPPDEQADVGTEALNFVADQPSESTDGWSSMDMYRHTDIKAGTSRSNRSACWNPFVTMK